MRGTQSVGRAVDSDRVGDIERLPGEVAVVICRDQKLTVTMTLSRLAAQWREGHSLAEGAGA